jgi:hypothetical protein
LRTDAFDVHQYVVHNDETAGSFPDDSDAVDNGDGCVAAGIHSPSVSHELELFPERHKPPSECVQLQQWQFSDETLPTMGCRGGILKRQHVTLPLRF